MSRGPDAARRAETKNLLRRLLLLSILIATKNHKAQARDPIGRQRRNIIFFFSFLKTLFGVSSCGFFSGFGDESFRVHKKRGPPPTGFLYSQ